VTYFRLQVSTHESSKGCPFAEDKYIPNDGEQIRHALATQNQGQYTLSVPTKGCARPASTP